MKNYLMTAVAVLLSFGLFAQMDGATVTPTDGGYLFDVSIKGNENNIDLNQNEFIGARIEVYNNTTDSEHLFLENHQSSNFQVELEKGNHYTLMVRKEGYFNKRMEAFVDVEDCILCFQGIGKVEPNVDHAMTDNSKSGALLAEIKMDKIELNKIIQIDNIYYDLDKWNIRPDAAKELNKVVQVLKNHPGIIIELGSHTDSRGRDEYNLSLSEKRAQAAVKYIVDQGGINPERILGKGYGENQLVNSCGNGVQCSDLSHQKNRRTELKITGIQESGKITYQSLGTIIKDEIANGNNTLSAK